MQRLEDKGGCSDSVKGKQGEKAHGAILKDHEPLSIMQFLLDLEYGEDLVDSILSWDGAMGRGGNGINGGDRDGVIISDARDNDNDALW